MMIFKTSLKSLSYNLGVEEVIPDRVQKFFKLLRIPSPITSSFTTNMCVPL
jgi:hypothetical protein